MSSDEDSVEEPKKAAETWVITFADMMSLLMSFFVLLLSFSEQDAAKFKEVGGSLEEAFGVQREVIAYEIAKGTSLIAREFSPGKPVASAVKEIHQKTADDFKLALEFEKRKSPSPIKIQQKVEEKTQPVIVQKKVKTNAHSPAEIKKKLDVILKDEIKQNKIELISNDKEVIIRILEKGFFASGDDGLQPTFAIVLAKIAKVLINIPGIITVAGHTDNVPIKNERFQSNWDLSAARAISVVHYFITKQAFDPSKLHVSAYADTKPVATNATDDGRKRNRRVEIVLATENQPGLKVQGDQPYSVEQLKEVLEPVNQLSNETSTAIPFRDSVLGPIQNQNINVDWKPNYLRD